MGANARIDLHLHSSEIRGGGWKFGVCTKSKSNGFLTFTLGEFAKLGLLFQFIDFVITKFKSVTTCIKMCINRNEFVCNIFLSASGKIATNTVKQIRLMCSTVHCT